MRKTALLVLFGLTAFIAYAGDVASFVNLGFSADGRMFAFGQYGVSDGTYVSYADVYCVDVAKNEFVKGGKASSSASDAAGKDGKQTLDSVIKKVAPALVKASVDPSLVGRAIYVQADDSAPVKDIAFRDFETGRDYSVALKSLSEGSGESVRSSFYLVVSIKDSSGNETRKTVGLPGFKRPGVKDYQIRRIIADASGSSVVFVIEKEVADKRGNSVRFMVETLRL